MPSALLICVIVRNEFERERCSTNLVERALCVGIIFTTSLVENFLSSTLVAVGVGSSGST